MRYFKLLVRGIVECVGEFRSVLNRRPGLVAASSALLGQWLLRKALPGAPFAPHSLANRVVRVLPGDFATRSIDLLGHRALDLTAGASLVAALDLAFGIGRHWAAFFGISAFGLMVLAAAVDPVHPRSSPQQCRPRLRRWQHSARSPWCPSNLEGRSALRSFRPGAVSSPEH